jgi:hypothetical protein
MGVSGNLPLPKGWQQKNSSVEDDFYCRGRKLREKWERQQRGDRKKHFKVTSKITRVSV